MNAQEFQLLEKFDDLILVNREFLFRFIDDLGPDPVYLIRNAQIGEKVKMKNKMQFIFKDRFNGEILQNDDKVVFELDIDSKEFKVRGYEEINYN